MKGNIEDLLVKIYKRLTEEDFDPVELLFLNYSTDFKNNVELFVKNYSNTVLYWDNPQFKGDMLKSFDDKKDFERAFDIVTGELWNYLEEHNE